MISKIIIILCVVVTCLSVDAYAWGEQTGITDDGRKVRKKEDGTWEYVNTKEKDTAGKEATTWGDVGRATLRGGVTGVTGGPYGAAAGGIVGGGKELFKKQVEDGQSELEKGSYYRSYKARGTQEGLQPGQPGYLSEKEKKQAYERATRQRAEE